jgi:urea transport system permease protein
MLDFLQKRASSETDDVARQALLLALANLQLASPQADVRRRLSSCWGSLTIRTFRQN